MKVNESPLLMRILAHVFSAKSSLLCCALYSLSGCCTAVDYPIGVPDRPDLIGLTPAEQAEMSPETLLKIANDYSRLQGHILKMEARVKAHDENL